MTEPLAADWDPAPQEREWYRNVATGDLGWVVRRGGAQKIRLDRASEEIIRSLNAEWVPENEHRPMTIAQVGQVAFEADRRLCWFIGMAENAKKEWADLNDDQRIMWMQTGPTKNPMRRELYEAVTGVLRKYAR